MNREIKFRAWDENNKNMFFSFDGFDYSFDAMSICDWLNGCGYKVMQYVGLKDKNDKDIYEGDIIFIHNHNQLEVVEFEYGRFGFYLYDSVKRESGRFEVFDDYPQNNIEILGNIYENPSLLKLVWKNCIKEIQDY
jgi:hypothetical protein